MQELLYYIRDNLVGTHYFIYAFILLFFMFALVGYLFKQKYGKYEIKLNTSQGGKKEDTLKKNIEVDKTIVQTANPVDKVPTNVKVEPSPIKVEQTPPVVVKPMPASPQPVNPVPTPNTNSTVNPTVIPNPVPQKLEKGPIPEI